MAFLPSDDLGIVILANADAKSAAEMQLIKRIMADALHLDTDSWDVPPLKPSQRLRSQDPTELTLPIEDYAGRYWGPGYGSITLCSPISTSSYCRTVLNTFSKLDNVTSADNRNTLYAEYASIWSSHIRVTHVDGDEFHATFTMPFLEGYGRNSTPFETWEEGEGDFVVKFDLRPDPYDNTTQRVFAFGLMGSEEEQGSRKRLVQSSLGTDEQADVTLLAVAPFMRTQE